MGLPKLDGAKRDYKILRLAKQFYAAGPHPVQAVRSCPWPECMVLKCTHIIRRHGPHNLTRLVGPKSLTAGAIEGFIANAPNRTKLRLGIQRNFALITAMIKAQPCLKRDFQVCATMVPCSI